MKEEEEVSLQNWGMGWDMGWCRQSHVNLYRTSCCSCCGVGRNPPTHFFWSMGSAVFEDVGLTVVSVVVKKVVGGRAEEWPSTKPGLE